jgi:hypothetical protein
VIPTLPIPTLPIPTLPIPTLLPPPVTAIELVFEAPGARALVTVDGGAPQHVAPGFSTIDVRGKRLHRLDVRLQGGDAPGRLIVELIGEAPFEIHGPGARVHGRLIVVALPAGAESAFAVTF